MKIAFGIFIDLTKTEGYPYSGSSSIGLGTDGFRWITQETNNTTEAYAHGVLGSSFSSSIYESVDVRRGGGVANTGGSSVTIGNDIQFEDKLKTYDINIIGRPIYIYEFDLDIAHGSTSANRTTLRRGIIKSVSYDRFGFNIQYESAHLQRNANILTVINEDSELDSSGESVVSAQIIGKVIPATFGEHEYAKLVRVADKETLINSGTHTTPNNLTVFPCYKDANESAKYVYLKASTTNMTDFSWSDSDEMYLKCVRGAGQGEIRKVSGTGLFNNQYLIVETEESFETTPASNDGANDDYDADNQSWYSFVEIYRNYKSDEWTGKAFLDDDGDPETNGPPISEYDNGFDTAGRYTIDIVGSNNNELEFKPGVFENNPDEIKGYTIITPISMERDTGSTDIWDFGLPYQTSGIWHNEDSPSITSETSSPWVSNVNDRNNSTYYELALSVGANIVSRFLGVPYKIVFPEINQKKIDKAYLCVDLECSASVDSGVGITIQTSGWIGKNEIHLNSTTDSTNGGQIAKPGDSTVYGSIPDFWYTNTDVNQFYPNKDTDADYVGRVHYEIPFTEISELNQPNEWYLTFAYGYNNSARTMSIKIKQIALVLESSADVSEKVFSPLQGRIWDTGQTWATSTDMINTPLDVLMHIKMLQNWSEISSPPANGWGKGYPASTLINTTSNANGSWINYDIDAGTLQYDADTSRQIIDYKDGDTYEICKNLCKQFLMINWIDSDGYENVAQYADKTSYTISETIGFDDIVPGSKIGISSIDRADIFTNFEVNFCGDSEGNYSKQIKIKDAEKNLTGTDILDAVIGDITNQEKYELWKAARQLYLDHGVVNTAPSDMSNHLWITEYDDAVSYIKELQRMMGVLVVSTAETSQIITKIPKKYISFTVPYETGRLWAICHRVKVNFPSETDGNTREVLILRQNKNISADNPSVTITGLMYDF